MEKIAGEQGSGGAGEPPEFEVKPKAEAGQTEVKRLTRSKRRSRTNPPNKPLLERSVTVYRAKLPLAKGQKIIERGALTRLEWLDEGAIDRLIKSGGARPVISPPLMALAGWETRGKRLAEVGVQTLADFLAVAETAFDELVAVLRAKPETVERWTAELRGWDRGEPPQK